ncbi:MAG: hypothetical protein ABIG37_02205 [Nanoarchaeota archaeon]|nr:hypothetical protein [Nanoarchaeota archaeon]
MKIKKFLTEALTPLVIGAWAIALSNLGKRSSDETLEQIVVAPIKQEMGLEILRSGVVKKKVEDDLMLYARYTSQFEGKRDKVYDPNPNDNKLEPTIGVGHYLDRADSRETFGRVLPEVDYDLVYSGKQKLTEEQIDKLFASDIEGYVKIARNLFPKFETYPEYLRQALIDGCYRGDLLDSPKTRKLINKGNFQEASQEYINRKDYRNAEKNGMKGIVIRMNRNREAMRRFGRK